jgi:hypothetical protein
MKAKISLVSALAATILLAGAGSAAAAGDPRIPAPNGPAEIPALACGFTVLDVPLASNEYFVQTTANPDGSLTMRVTGQLVVQLTNETTGKSVTVNASGPGTGTFYPDGSAAYDLQGPLLNWFTPDAQARYGVPGLALISGHTTATADPSGTLTSLQIDGQVTDLCAALR